MGTFSRKKGIRNELLLRDHFRALGYQSVRVPLSGAAQGHKGDVLFEKNGKTLKAECKARKSAFFWLYDYLDEHKFSRGFNQPDALAIILDEERKELCVVSKLLENVLKYEGSYWALPANKEFARVAKRLQTLRKVVKDCDVLAVKDDRKDFLFVRYL